MDVELAVYIPQKRQIDSRLTPRVRNRALWVAPSPRRPPAAPTDTPQTEGRGLDSLVTSGSQFQSPGSQRSNLRHTQTSKSNGKAFSSLFSVIFESQIVVLFLGGLLKSTTANDSIYLHFIRETCHWRTCGDSWPRQAWDTFNNNYYPNIGVDRLSIV